MWQPVDSIGGRLSVAWTRPADRRGEAPGTGVGFWAGASSAALDTDGTFVVVYRTRHGDAKRGSTVVARSEDGQRLTIVATLSQERFGAASMERPAIVRTGEARW